MAATPINRTIKKGLYCQISLINLDRSGSMLELTPSWQKENLSHRRRTTDGFAFCGRTYHQKSFLIRFAGQRGYGLNKKTVRPEYKLRATFFQLETEVKVITLFVKFLSKTDWGSVICQTRRALSSVVEHYLHTVGVAGSKPAARTILCLRCFC